MYVATADYYATNAPEIFAESLKNTGFGVIKNHPINAQLINDVYDEWRKFFNSDEKFQYPFDNANRDGYYPYLSENAKNTPIKDLKEYYHVYAAGRMPKSMSPKTMQLFNQLKDLAGTLLQWLENQTPAEIRTQLSQPLSAMIANSPRISLRVLHYPPITGTEEKNAVRSAPHEDINLITLLPAATATGLEVKDKNNNWHAVESDPGTIIINAGDMLQLCTNRYYISTTHRVVNPEGEAAKHSRYSMPMFVHPRDDVKLSDKHTRLSYYQERMKENGVM